MSASPAAVFQGIRPARNAAELRRLRVGEEAWSVLTLPPRGRGYAPELLGAALVRIVDVPEVLSPLYVRAHYHAQILRSTTAAGVRVGEVREFDRADLFAVTDEDAAFAALVTHLWGRS